MNLSNQQKILIKRLSVPMFLALQKERRKLNESKQELDLPAIVRQVITEAAASTSGSADMAASQAADKTKEFGEIEEKFLDIMNTYVAFLRSNHKLLTGEADRQNAQQAAEQFQEFYDKVNQLLDAANEKNDKVKELLNSLEPQDDDATQDTEGTDRAQPGQVQQVDDPSATPSDESEPATGQDSPRPSDPATMEEPVNPQGDSTTEEPEAAPEAEQAPAATPEPEPEAEAEQAPAAPAAPAAEAAEAAEAAPAAEAAEAAEAAPAAEAAEEPESTTSVPSAREVASVIKNLGYDGPKENVLASFFATPQGQKLFNRLLPYEKRYNLDEQDLKDIRKAEYLLELYDKGLISEGALKKGFKRLGKRARKALEADVRPYFRKGKELAGKALGYLGKKGKELAGKAAESASEAVFEKSPVAATMAVRSAMDKWIKTQDKKVQEFYRSQMSSGEFWQDFRKKVEAGRKPETSQATQTDQPQEDSAQEGDQPQEGESEREREERRLRQRTDTQVEVPAVSDQDTSMEGETVGGTRADLERTDTGQQSTEQQPAEKQTPAQEIRSIVSLLKNKQEEFKEIEDKIQAAGKEKQFEFVLEFIKKEMASPQTPEQLQERYTGPYGVDTPMRPSQLLFKVARLFDLLHPGPENKKARESFKASIVQMGNIADKDKVTRATKYTPEQQAKFDAQRKILETIPHTEKLPAYAKKIISDEGKAEEFKNALNLYLKGEMKYTDFRRKFLNPLKGKLTEEDWNKLHAFSNAVARDARATREKQKSANPREALGQIQNLPTVSKMLKGKPQLTGAFAEYIQSLNKGKNLQEGKRKPDVSAHVVKFKQWLAANNIKTEANDQILTGLFRAYLSDIQGQQKTAQPSVNESKDMYDHLREHKKQSIEKNVKNWQLLAGIKKR